MTQKEILWKYQEAETELDRLRKELEATPERQKLRKLRRVLQEQSDRIEALRAGIKERETELAGSLTKLEQLLKDYDLEQEELEIMMNDEEATAEELADCRKALEALLTKINALKKTVQDCREWLEKTVDTIKDVYAKGVKTKRDYEAARAVVETEKLEHKPVIDKAQKEVDLIGAQLSPDLLKRYKSIKKKHPNPVASVSGNRCSGCGMSLPMAAVRKFAAGTEILECENCGRLLCGESD